MYSIGHFSKICNIPVKTLRYYNDIGLLQPSHIDPETDYRYYDYDKISEVNKIALFKKCQFTLSEIKELLQESDSQLLMKAVNKKLEELEKKKQQICKSIDETNMLKEKLTKGEVIAMKPPMSDCFIENIGELEVVSVRKTIAVKFIDELVKELFDLVYSYSFHATGKLMAIFHHTQEKEELVDVEVLLPVEGSLKIEKIKKLPVTTYACIRVKGPYSELSYGYDELMNWINTNQYKPIGEAIEIYEEGLVPQSIKGISIKPNINKSPFEFITKICIPIQVEQN